jgi:hypothetical protein
VKRITATTVWSAIAILICISCASSGTGVSDRVTVYGSPELIWLAAQSAAQAMGGRIVQANRSTGAVVVDLDAEGNTVRLDVTIFKSPGFEHNDDYPVDVSVLASFIGIDEPDPGLRETLERILEEYVRNLEQSARRR